jgi:hypothetical protein
LHLPGFDLFFVFLVLTVLVILVEVIVFFFVGIIDWIFENVTSRHFGDPKRGARRIQPARPVKSPRTDSPSSPLRA